ncbi:hypothetical protein [Fictibacillus sp. BK138]|uniref:hypothetical protein n=1 Tax=Fictibacillus sp. BK138 TaxID=2512121 RepID=UPI00102A4924|nr:hypothetical protein [Fictibacillus sp. BK138]RZT15551.1 hypothetical protein EV282_3756 [Fictibacillus sp. BK138]
MKIKKVLGMGMLTLALSFAFQTETSAAAVKNLGLLKSLKVNTKTDNVKLLWSNIGSRYEVLQDGEKIYEGSRNSFSHKMLDEGSQYNYELKAYDNKNNVVDVVEIKTSTIADISKMSEKEQKNPFNYSKITSIIDRSENVLKLDWQDIMKVKTYEVSINGEQITNLKNSEFIDYSPNLSEDSQYNILSKRMVDEKQKVEIDKSIENNPFITMSEREKYYYEDLSMMFNLSPKKTENEVQGVTKNWSIMYKTFIPSQYVYNPIYKQPYPYYGNEYAYFNGDARSYSSSDTDIRYKTKTVTNVTVSDTTRSVTLPTRAIGMSKGYDANYNLMAEARDTPEEIYIGRTDYTTAGAIGFTLLHASNNVLIWSSPDIDYDYSGTFRQNGSVYLHGSHDQMPNHEMYIKGPGATYYSTTVFRHDLMGAMYLEPAHPQKYWSASFQF